MKKRLAAVLTLCISSYSGFLFADDSVVSSQLEGIIVEHIAATSKDSESIENLMKTMHTESPVSMQLKMQMEQIFPAIDMNASLVGFNFIGMDGDYAIARAKQKLEKVSGPAQFKSNSNEQIVVFKQELGQWKIWQMAMLNMDFL